MHLKLLITVYNTFKFDFEVGELETFEYNPVSIISATEYNTINPI